MSRAVARYMMDRTEQASVEQYQQQVIRSCFVTGTDVGVGKTLIASALVHLLRIHGIHTVGMKPVAAGATLDHGHWRHLDLEQLAEESSFALPGRVLCMRSINHAPCFEGSDVIGVGRILVLDQPGGSTMFHGSSAS